MDNTNSARKTANAMNSQQASTAPLQTVDLLPLVNSMKMPVSFDMKVSTFTPLTTRPMTPLSLPSLNAKPKAAPSNDEFKFTTTPLLNDDEGIGFSDHPLAIVPDSQETPTETPKSVVLPAKTDVSENVFARAMALPHTTAQTSESPQTLVDKGDTHTAQVAQQDRTQTQEQVQKKFDSITTILQDISGGNSATRRTERTVSEKAPAFSVRNDNNRRTNANEAMQAADSSAQDDGFLGMLSEFFGAMAGIAGFVFSDARPTTGTGRR